MEKTEQVVHFDQKKNIKISLQQLNSKLYIFFALLETLNA